MREIQRADLYDANVNGLLAGPADPRLPGGPDERSFPLWLFTSSTPNEPGVLRAVLSDRCGVIDNLDVLTAVLDGIRLADTEVTVRSCDLRESSMHCKVYSPKIRALAPIFLENYRTPFATPELEAERQRVAGQIATAATGPLIEAIRARVANPVHAAAMVIGLLSGARIEELNRIPYAGFTGEELIFAPMQVRTMADVCVCAVPSNAQLAIEAARSGSALSSPTPHRADL